MIGNEEKIEESHKGLDEWSVIQSEVKFLI